MSGGSIGEYGFHRVRDAAYEIRTEIRRQPERDEYAYRPETLDRFEQVAKLLDIAADAWKDVDWLVSCDTGEGNWLSPEVAEVLDRLDN